MQTVTKKAVRKPPGSGPKQVLVPLAWHRVISYISDRTGLTMTEVMDRALKSSNLKKWMEELQPPEIPK